MTHSLRYFAAAVLGALLTLTALGLWVSTTHANPLYYPVATQSATATTSVTWLTSSGAASQATSTALDSYQASVTNGWDELTLIVQTAASSTSSSLNVRFQYSINGIDWADDNVSQSVGNFSTTTATASVQVPLSYQWLAAGTATSSKILNVATPARFVRAIFTQTGAAGNLWYAWQPVRQGK